MKRIRNWLLQHLYVALTISDVVSQDKAGNLYVDGKPVTKDEIRQIQAEIKAMDGFRIWKLMGESTKSAAEERLYRKAVTADDMVFGKAMLYNLSLQKSILESFRNKLH